MLYKENCSGWSNLVELANLFEQIWPNILRRYIAFVNIKNETLFPIFSDTLIDAPPIASPPPSVSAELIHKSP